MTSARLAAFAAALAVVLAPSPARAVTDGCVNHPDGTHCQTACTQGGVCQGGVCVGGAAVPDGTLCATGDPCTLVDTCAGGVCQRGATITCPALPCRSGTCVPFIGCLYTYVCDMAGDDLASPPDAGQPPPDLAASTPPDFAETSPPDFAGSAPPDFAGTTPPDFAGTTPPDFAGTTPPDFAGSAPPDLGEGTAADLSMGDEAGGDGADLAVAPMGGVGFGMAAGPQDNVSWPDEPVDGGADSLGDGDAGPPPGIADVRGSGCDLAGAARRPGPPGLLALLFALGLAVRLGYRRRGSEARASTVPPADQARRPSQTAPHEANRISTGKASTR